MSDSIADRLVRLAATASRQLGDEEYDRQLVAEQLLAEMKSIAASASEHGVMYSYNSQQPLRPATAGEFHRYALSCAAGNSGRFTLLGQTGEVFIIGGPEITGCSCGHTLQMLPREGNNPAHWGHIRAVDIMSCKCQDTSGCNHLAGLGTIECAMCSATGSPDSFVVNPDDEHVCKGECETDSAVVSHIKSGSVAIEVYRDNGNGKYCVDVAGETVIRLDTPDQARGVQCLLACVDPKTLREIAGQTRNVQWQ